MPGYIEQVFDFNIGDLHVEGSLREGDSPVRIGVFGLSVAFELNPHRPAIGNRAGTHNSIILLRKLLNFVFAGYSEWKL